MKNIDLALYDALSPMEEPSSDLNKKILNANKKMNMSKVVPIKHRVSFSAAASILALLIAFSSVTAYAAWKFLSAGDVAAELSDEKLASEFNANNILSEGETQSFEDYGITLLGVVSGKDISDYLVMDNGEVINDNTYAVVAICRNDGAPMPEASSEDYGKEDFLVSPYIEGLDPAKYNIYTLNAGGYSAVVKNGIQYRIIEVENIEAFADREIYIGVSDGSFYNNEAFIYDENTGKIARNEHYQGVNALFVLPVDAVKADKDKANDIIQRAGNNSGKEDTENISETKDIDEFMAKLTPDNIDEYATPIESTRQTITPDKDGYYDYEYQVDGVGSVSGTACVKFLFTEGKTGMSDCFGYSSGEDLAELLIETHTLNADGTITFVVYMPKEK